MMRLPSPLTNARRCGRLLGAAGAAALLGLAGANASAATTPIYKCLDRNLGVLYTDLPCKDGERMDLRAGDADPAAMARLERERDALDRNAAQRIADDHRAALQRNYAQGPAYGVDYGDAGYADAGAYAPYGGYGYLAFAPAHRQARSDGNDALARAPAIGARLR